MSRPDSSDTRQPVDADAADALAVLTDVLTGLRNPGIRWAAETWAARGGTLEAQLPKVRQALDALEQVTFPSTIFPDNWWRTTIQEGLHELRKSLDAQVADLIQLVNPATKTARHAALVARWPDRNARTLRAAERLAGWLERRPRDPAETSQSRRLRSRRTGRLRVLPDTPGPSGHDSGGES